MSSSTTDPESDLIQMNIPLGNASQQRLKESIKHLYQDGTQIHPENHDAYQVNQIYGSQYSTQYSSDSGYSTTTDEQQPRKKKIPHPHMENTLFEMTRNKDVDIYATLPRKGTQKAALRNQSKEADVYQAYLQKQKEMQLKPRQRSDSESSIANLSTTGNHSRQSSGASLRMSKEEINQHLSDFVRTKQGNKEGKKQAAAEKQLQKMLYEDMIKMQRRQMNFKDGKQPLPVQPPTIPDSKMHLYKAVANQNQVQPVVKQHPSEGYGTPVYVDHKQLHDMNNQSLLSYAQNLPYGTNNHSRESSASSSHTLKAHSRDNSLTSQGHGTVHGVYGSHKPTHPPLKIPQKSQSQNAVHSSNSSETHPHVTDRRIHNTSTDDMHPFPGAVPLIDPGGSRSTDTQQKGGLVARRIAALTNSKGKGNPYTWIL